MREVFFNNQKLNNYVIIKDIRDSILPSIETITKSQTGANGSYFIRKRLSERKIEIDVEIISDTYTEREESIMALASLLYTEEEKFLKLDNGRTYKASLTDTTNLDNLNTDATTTLTFIATDPISYGEKKEVELNKKNINNGTYPTQGIIILEITEDTDYLHIQLQETGEFIHVEDSFVRGDIVKIDLKEEEIYKNDISILYKLFLESDFFSIPVGAFYIETNIENAILEYQERWL